jgi:hypothetical protein
MGLTLKRFIIHGFPVGITAAALTAWTIKRIKVGKFIIGINRISSALTIRTFTLVFHVGEMVLISCFSPLIKRAEQSHIFHLNGSFYNSMGEKWNIYA